MRNENAKLEEIFSIMADETLLYKLEQDEIKSTFHLGVLTGLGVALHILYEMKEPDELVKIAVETCEKEISKT